MDLTNKTIPPVLTFRASWSSVWGNKLQEPTIINENPLIGDWNTNPNLFYLDGYVDQSGGEFPKPLLQVVEVLKTRELAIDRNDYKNLSIELVEIDTVSDRIYFQIVDSNYGTNVGGAVLSEQQDRISISVHINA